MLLISWARGGLEEKKNKKKKRRKYRGEFFNNTWFIGSGLFQKGA